MDFTDDNDESYELYGAGYRLLSRPEFGLRVGKYLNRKDVDYDWDFAGCITFFLNPDTKAKPYFTVWVHHVTEDGEGRARFTDYAGEFGLTLNKGFRVFARYQALHDLDKFGGITDHHVLVGPKYVW